MRKLYDYITEHMFSGKKVTVNSQKRNEYVDLDLPSGTKWATCNVGADKPEDAGLLFQWGRTDGYKYNDSNHKFLNDYRHLNYSTSSGKIYETGKILTPADDAAYKTTKGKFRMPTKKELDELIDCTFNFWTEYNGVKGRKFASMKNKSKWIFIPANGFFYNGKFEYQNECCYIWSSYIYSKNPFFPYAHIGDSTDCYNDNFARNCAMSIRGVIE